MSMAPLLRLALTSYKPAAVRVRQVETYWEGPKLVTSEQTARYNGGKPIVCSRWVTADDVFVSHFEFGGERPYIAYCERTRETGPSDVRRWSTSRRSSAAATDGLI